MLQLKEEGGESSTLQQPRGYKEMPEYASNEDLQVQYLSILFDVI